MKIILLFFMISLNIFCVENELDEIAKFISGIEVSSENLKKQFESKEFQDFSFYMEKSWKEVYEKRLNFMKDWRDSEISDAVKTTETLFYPFSGPDFLNAFIFFPNAKTYILFGLEPIGNLPNISEFKEKSIKHYLNNLKVSISDVFGKSYFLTNNMKDQFSDSVIDGTIPIIAFFLASTKHSIISMDLLSFSKEQVLISTPYELKKKDSVKNKNSKNNYIGIKFVVKDEFSNEKSVYYFSQDIGDYVFKTNSPLYKFFNNFENFTTYLKSASYLLHYGARKNIRDLLISKSKYILQDDTGIPYRYFKDNWTVKFYGTYQRPVNPFKSELLFQQDLKEYYEKNKKTISELPFNLGYHPGKNKNSLMFFTKK